MKGILFRTGFENAVATRDPAAHWLKCDVRWLIPREFYF